MFAAAASSPIFWAVRAQPASSNQSEYGVEGLYGLTAKKPR